MQGLAVRTNAVLDALPRRCLQKRGNGGRRIQDDHRASRSSRSKRAVSILRRNRLTPMEVLSQFR